MSGSSEVVPGVRLETDLRLIREAQGLSINDVHWRTKIQPRVLQEFEHTGLKDNPIYANQTNRWAFVKSYAESLGVATEDAYNAFRAAQAGSYHGGLARKYLTIDPDDFKPPSRTAQKTDEPPQPAKAAAGRKSSVPHPDKPTPPEPSAAETDTGQANPDSDAAPGRAVPPLPARDHLEHWADLFGTVTLPDPTPRFSASSDDDETLADVRSIANEDEPPGRFEDPSVWTPPAEQDQPSGKAPWLPPKASDTSPKHKQEGVPSDRTPSRFAVPVGTDADYVLPASTAAGASKGSAFDWAAERPARTRSSARRKRRNLIYGVMGVVVIGLMVALYMIYQPFSSSATTYAEQRLVDVDLEELPEQFSGFIREDPEEPRFITIAIRQIDPVGRQFTYTMWSMEDGKMYSRNGIGDFNPTDGQLRLWNQYGWGGIYKDAQGTFILRSLEPKQYPNWELTGG